MPMLDVSVNGDNCWPDLKKKGFIRGEFTGIARLADGTVSGASTVTVRIELPDGKTVLAQTTLALLNTVMQAFNAAEGNYESFN